jgi:hypothetical protein
MDKPADNNPLSSLMALTNWIMATDRWKEANVSLCHMVAREEPPLSEDRFQFVPGCEIRSECAFIWLCKT